MKIPYVSRLAPTPNGEIHWGNLMNFSLTWALVRRSGGKLWLRFDDIDQDRCEETYAEGTRRILRLLGLTWDEEFSGQRRFLSDYADFLETIPRYVCACSRQDLLRRSGGHHYDGHCRNKGLLPRPGETSVRFLNPRGPAGDFVLWRREGIPSYHLTSIRDELRMGVNLIVRGEDLRESTQVQREISASLPADPFSKIDFVHHPLLASEDGEKLSKSRSHGDLLRRLENGESPESFWRSFSRLARLPREISGARELLELSGWIDSFNLERT